MIQKSYQKTLPSAWSNANTDKVIIASLRKRNQELSDELERYKSGVETLTKSVKTANDDNVKLKAEFVSVLQSAITNNNRTQMLSFLHTKIKHYLP